MQTTTRDIKKHTIEQIYDTGNLHFLQQWCWRFKYKGRNLLEWFEPKI